MWKRLSARCSCREKKIKLLHSIFCLFRLCGQNLEYVESFKYLGHIIKSKLLDDDDIQREIRNLFIRTNILIRRFKKCSLSVKLVLFRRYCLAMYDSALWKRYSVSQYTKLKYSYHKWLKKLFGFKSIDSVTSILFELSLPSFNTLMYNYRYSFRQQCLCTFNFIYEHFRNIRML